MADVVGEPAFRLARPCLEQAFSGERVRFEEFLPYEKAQPRYVQATYAPDMEADGFVRGVVAMVQDITVQKEMEQALRHSKERLQQVFAQAPVAVAVLRGRERVFELANPSYQDFFPAKELLGRPLIEAVPEAAAVLTIFQCVREAQSVLEDRINESDARITAQWLPTVYGDAKQLALVFQNLLSNALKYRKEHVSPDIHISAEPNDEQDYLDLGA